MALHGIGELAAAMDRGDPRYDTEKLPPETDIDTLTPDGSDLLLSGLEGGDTLSADEFDNVTLD